MGYHYKESGLDNIYLENGYAIHKTAYGDGISIHDTEGLHCAIGHSLVAMPKRLIGAELRFLRLEMSMTQRRLADVLNSDEQAVRRWEKNRGKPIPGVADRLVRIIYAEYVGGDGKIRDLIDRLTELDEIEQAKILMRDTGSGWQRSDQIAA